MTTLSEVQKFLNILGYKKGGGGGVTFPITPGQGGFGQSNTPVLGAVPYSTASSIALSAPSTKLGQYFRSGNAGVPTWSTLTLPDTIGVNNIFVANVANVVTTLGSTGSSMLYTNNAGVIGWSNAATIDVNGNFMTTAGIVETGTAYLVPVSGFNITLAVANHLTSLNPAGTIATGTITMPTTPANGQRLKVATTQTITALTVNANTGQTILAAPTTLLAGDSFEYIYNLSLTTWYPYEGTGQELPSATLLGNYLGTTGGAVPITLGTGLQFTGNVLNATGGGGGSGTVGAGTAGTLAFYAANGTVVSPLSLGTNLSISGSTLNAAGGGGGLSPTLAANNIFVGSAGNVATGVAMSGDATIASSGALTLATVLAAPGTYSSVTVNAKGLITAASNAPDDVIMVTSASDATDTLPTIYNNGTAGVGATLTYAATGAQILGGQPVVAPNSYLILDEGTTALNGIYTCTVTPATGVAGVMTRATFYNTPAQINSTATIIPQSGSQSNGRFILGAQITTIGTDAISYLLLIVSNPRVATTAGQALVFGSNRTFVQPGLIFPSPASLTTNSLLFAQNATTVGQLTLGSNLSITGTTLNAAGSTSNAQIQVQAATATAQAGVYVYAGAGGVGDTFTYTATGAVTYDGQATQLGKDYLWMGNGSGANGVWNATTLGTTGVKQVMTRSTLYDTAAKVQSNINIKVLTGSQLGNSSFFSPTNNPTMGTTNITYYPQIGYPVATVANGILLSGAASGANTLNTIAAPVAGTVLTGAGVGNAPAFTTNLNGATPLLFSQPAGATVTMNANTSYVAAVAATQSVYALPPTVNPGAILVVAQNPNSTSTGWKITQIAGQQIFFGTASTTAGVTGTLSSSAAGDSVTLMALTATTWMVISSQGNYFPTT